MDPNNAEAAALLAKVNQQLGVKPADTTRPAVAATTTRPTETADTPKAAARGLPRREVTADEINFIRQQEWRQGDRTVRVKLAPDVRKKALELGIVATADPARVTPQDMAYAILMHGPDALKRQVQIVSDPAPMTEFRQHVEKVLQTGCIQCHTVGKVERNNRFALFPGDTDGAVYSNYVLLQQFEKPVDGVQRSLLDRLRPEGSLLLLYALPPKSSDVSHPEVEGYKGIARTRNEPRFRELMAWISTLPPLPPAYNVDIDLSTEPADKADPKTGEPKTGEPKPTGTAPKPTPAGRPAPLPKPAAGGAGQ